MIERLFVVVALSNVQNAFDAAVINSHFRQVGFTAFRNHLNQTLRNFATLQLLCQRSFIFRLMMSRTVSTGVDSTSNLAFNGFCQSAAKLRTDSLCVCRVLSVGGGRHIFGADKITAVHVSRPRSCAEKREVCPLHNNESGLLAFWTEKMPFITLHVDMRVFFGFLTNVGDGNQTAFRIVVSVFVF